MTALYLTEAGSTLAASSRSLVVRHGGQERAQSFAGPAGKETPRARHCARRRRT
jgi:hypothetical protein